MLSTDKAWEKFGRSDPYFGVLADKKFAAENIKDNRSEFFDSGIGTVAQIISRCEDHFGALRRGRVLDHGCGVGRLTFALAEQFAEVLALDVSPSMIAEASVNAERFGTTNVVFAIADDELSNAVGSFDFVNSHMVLQHVPVRRGFRIMCELLDRLEDGGGFHFHISIRSDAVAARALWWASHHIPGIKIIQNILARRRWNAPAMQMNNYPINRLVELLTSRGIMEFLVAAENHAQFLTLSVIGRKNCSEGV